MFQIEVKIHLKQLHTMIEIDTLKQSTQNDHNKDLDRDSHLPGMVALSVTPVFIGEYTIYDVLKVPSNPYVCETAKPCKLLF